MKKVKWVLVPENLDLSTLMVQHEANGNVDMTTCYEIVNYICTGRPGVIKKGKVIEYAVPFKSDIAQKKYGKQSPSNVKFLENAGVIELVVNYSSDHHPRFYKPGDEYQYSYLKPVKVPVPTRYMIYNENVDRTTAHMYHYLFKWFNENLTIDNDALVWLNNNYQKSMETAQSEKTKRKGRNKYGKRAGSFYKIMEERFPFSQDDFGYRLYNIFTNMDSKMRRFIKYNGMRLVGVDIKNSQPMMSILILGNMLMNWEYIDRTNDARRIENKLTKPLGAEGYKELQQFITEYGLNDVQKYIDLVSSGEMYEYLVGCYAKYFGIKVNRGKAKGDMFRYLFAEPGAINPYSGDINLITKIMRIEFPNVDEVFSKIKTTPLINMDQEGNPHRQFAKLLQTIESEMVLDRMCKKIGKVYKEVPIFTIHDSIVTVDNPECFLPIRTVMLGEIQETLGVPGVVKYDFFDKKSPNFEKYGKNQ